VKTLRLQLRFLIPLLLTLVVAAYLTVPVMDRLTLRWFARDLNIRGELIANTLAEPIIDAVGMRNDRRLQTLIDRATQDERMVAIGLCSTDGKVLQRTAAFPKLLTCAEADRLTKQADPRLRIEGGPVHVGMHPISGEGGKVADLVLLHDLSFVDRRSQDTRRYLIILIAGLGLTMALITMVVAQLSWRGWVSGVRAIMRGEGLLSPMLSDAAGGNCAPGCATSRTNTGAPRGPTPNGTRTGCARC
jgi:trehalose 6-phosphate synthase